MFIHFLNLALVVAFAAQPKEICTDLLNPRGRASELYRLSQLKLNDRENVAALMGIDEKGVVDLIGIGKVEGPLHIQIFPLNHLTRNEALKRARRDARAKSIYATILSRMGIRKVTLEGHVLLFGIAYSLAKIMPPEMGESNFSLEPDELYRVINQLDVKRDGRLSKLQILAKNLGLRAKTIEDPYSDDAFFLEHLFRKLPRNSGFIIGLKLKAVREVQSEAMPLISRVQLSDISGLTGINATNMGSLELLLPH